MPALGKAWKRLSRSSSPTVNPPLTHIQSPLNLHFFLTTIPLPEWHKGSLVLVTSLACK